MIRKSGNRFSEKIMFKQRAVVFRTKMQPRRLTDSDLSSLNPRLGCEMMKISARLASSNRDGFRQLARR